MTSLVVWVTLTLMTLSCRSVTSQYEEETTTPIPTGDCVGRDEQLRGVVNSLARQMMLQQLFVEEKSRSDGDSGLKSVRLSYDGTRPYHANSHTSWSVAAIHDHPDHRNTVGMGELLAVLNGVEFRTRHNDYTLYEPSHTSNEYHASQPIDFPDVPPEVLNKPTPEEQITEMREWFKAWQNEDDSVRDYKKYFKPLLCYLEGAWITSTSSLDEPFESDRHHLDAKNWFDLQEKIRYTAYQGSKDNAENLAYLPTTIIGFNETTGLPTFAQFNYRIMCHPFSKNIPRSYFKPSGDLHHRYASKKTLEEYMKLRSARFVLDEGNRDTFRRWGLMDELMKEIPGKDNHGAVLRDSTFGLNTADVFDKGPLNAAYYHRWYLLAEDGAMGSNVAHRGFNDRNLWVAQNSRPEVAGVKYQFCDDGQSAENGDCTMEQAKVSYAFPLEVIYLTPLQSWNPYDIEYKGEAWSDEGQTVTANGRNGGFDPATALDGNNRATYYRTPSAFFGDGEVNSDDADTLDAFVGVLDKNGVVRNVTASGMRIHLPAIPGVAGNLRTRYPIMPIYGEGSTVWKELEALKAMVMDMQANRKYFEKDPGLVDSGDGDVGEDDESFDSFLETSFSTSPRTGNHKHTITFTDEDYETLENGGTIKRESSVANGHSHEFTFHYSDPTKEIIITKCGSQTPVGGEACWDKHGDKLFMEESLRLSLGLPSSLG